MLDIDDVDASGDTIGLIGNLAHLDHEFLELYLFKGI
jgi:hypothetical protein